MAGKSEQVPEYAEIRNSGHSGGDFVFQLAKASSGRAEIKTPEIELKEPSKTGFSMDDLEKQAKQIEGNKAGWNATMKEMKQAYNQVTAYEKKDVTPELKIAAWQKFINTFSEKNPYSDEDEAMRQKAQAQTNYWQAEQGRLEQKKAEQKTAMGIRPPSGSLFDTGGKIVKDSITGMEFVFVKGGCYQMGDTFGDGGSDEKPVHEVCVDDFYIGKYEVTQGPWQAIMGNTPSSFKNCGNNCPVERVSWDDAQEYISKLNSRSGGNKYRLPTEAEWEYAARSGGKSEKYSGGDDVDRVAWFDGNSGSKTHQVGTKTANGLRIYDMSGNVWEWVQDWYEDNYYRNSPRDNPTGPNSGIHRVLRGGSWDDNARDSRAASRLGFKPAVHNYYVGFRLVRTP